MLSSFASKLHLSQMTRSTLADIRFVPETDLHRIAVRHRIGINVRYGSLADMRHLPLLTKPGKICCLNFKR